MARLRQRVDDDLALAIRHDLERLPRRVPHGFELPVLRLEDEQAAVHLAAGIERKGLDDRVQVRHFHKWCRQQLVAFGQPIPAQGPAMFDEMVDNVIRAVDRQQIPAGQYRAILIDEGHDFQPQWLKLVAQMVDPATNSLLVLYDDAQSIYERRRTKQFSFKSVGIQAQGRTTILKINYRNTRQVLQTARMIAADILRPDDQGEDGIPLLQPISCGRDGRAPVVIRLPGLRSECDRIAELFAAAHEEGRAWSEMAILYRRHSVMDECAAALTRRRLPHQVRRRPGRTDPASDTIRVMTMHASKGLEFPLVALAGVGHMPEPGEDEADEARLFYVAATRATESLVITLSGRGAYMDRFPPDPAPVRPSSPPQP